MANSTEISLPNPFTPMAFLPPDLAYQKTITEYVTVGGLSVLIWDILTHLPFDFKLLIRQRVTFPTIIYFLSRWSTLLYAISTAVFETAPVENCVTLSKVVCAVYHVTISSTALLFFLRVRAIFDRNRYITIGFFILWLGVLGGSLTAVLSLSGTHVGNTKYCAFSNFKAYRSAANITLVVFDTCVLIAITWRLSNTHLTVKSDDVRSKTNFNLLGKYLPAFSRALLQDGQKYYMVAVLANLLVLIMEFAPGLPLPYRAIFLAPAIELTNIMGCRVFRRTKKWSATSEVHAVSSIMFQKSNNIPVFVHTERSTNYSIGNELRSVDNSDILSSPRDLALLKKEAMPGDSVV